MARPLPAEARTMAIEEESAKRAAERDGPPPPSVKVRALLATFEMPAGD